MQNGQQKNPTPMQALDALHAMTRLITMPDANPQNPAHSHENCRALHSIVAAALIEAEAKAKVAATAEIEAVTSTT